MKVSIKRATWVLGCVLAMEALGCGGPVGEGSKMPTAMVPEKAKDIECPVAVEAGKPVLCLSKSTAVSYVVGLARGHGWRPKDRVMLRKPYPGMPEGRPIAMARVRYAFEDAVEVKILYQIPGENNVLDGAMAQAVPAGERVRLAQYVGRVLEQDKAGRVKLDVGKSDGAEVGDMYSVLEEGAGDAIARVKLTEVRDLEAWGKVMDWHEPVRVGMDAQYEGPDDGKIATPISVVVVDFMAKSVGDAGEAKAGKEFARDLVKALERAAEGMPYLKVKYAPEEKVKGLSGEAEGHREAQALGKKMGADVVVWGVMQCDIRGCALPRFTVVEGSRLAQGRFRGEEIWVEKKGDGFKFEGKAPEDPLALGAALLGEVFYKAERYKDAKFYLGMALRKGVLRGRDALVARDSVAYALMVLGQSRAAREQFGRLGQEAKVFGSGFFETIAWGKLAVLDHIEGKIADARTGYMRVLGVGNREKGETLEPEMLHQLAILEAQQGKAEEASKLYVRSLELKRQLGDTKGEAVTLNALATLKVQQGRIDEASKLYERSLQLRRQLGSAQGEAATLNELANLEMQKGRVDESARLFTRALYLARQVGDTRSEGAMLHGLAILEGQQGRIDEAQNLYTSSLGIAHQIGDLQGEATTLFQLAVLEERQQRGEEAKRLYGRALGLSRQCGDAKLESSIFYQLGSLAEDEGRIEEAKQLYIRVLELKRQIDDVRGQATVLHALGHLEHERGNVDEAKQFYARALELWRQASYVQGEIATLSSLAILAWKSNLRSEARQTWTIALEKARAIRSVDRQADLLFYLGQDDEAQGFFASAKERYAESLALFTQLKIPERIQSLTQQVAIATLLDQAQKAHPTLIAQGAIWVMKIFPDGQAAKTTLQPGDILSRYNNIPLPNGSTFHALVKSTPATTPVTLDILRGSQRLRIQVHGGLLGIGFGEFIAPTTSTAPTSP